MPQLTRTLRVDDVHRHVTEHCFATPGDPGLVGVEIEWLTVPASGPAAHPVFEHIRSALEGAGPLPGAGRLSFEPGGQVELSSLPHRHLGDACTATARDRAAIAAALAAVGVVPACVGLDPGRAPRRVIRGGRYDAMEAYFDCSGPEGRRMMCSTASVQVNVGLGPDADRRWQLANLLGPTLNAAFANSPLLHGVPSGWRSCRLATWRSLDRTRTFPVPQDRPCAEAWAQYALEARVMLIRPAADGVFVPVLEPLTFRDWVEHGHALGFPTEDDLAYHLTTLFPPVRPRGWLELRMFDSLPEPWWRVAVAVSAAVLFDEDAGEAAARAARPAAGLWSDAARHGPAHPVLAEAARGVFAAALDALGRVGADAETAGATAAFVERYVARGRCPADDRLAAWTEHGTMYPVESGPARRPPAAVGVDAGGPAELGEVPWS